MQEGVFIADACKVIVARIGVAALTISQVVADGVIVIALDALDVMLLQEGEDTIGMRAESAEVSQAEEEWMHTPGSEPEIGVGTFRPLSRSIDPSYDRRIAQSSQRDGTD